jgi:hypothetical protein
MFGKFVDPCLQLSVKAKTVSVLAVISSFRRDVDEICTLLGCYAVSSGNPLLTFCIGPIFKAKKSNEAGLLDH